MKWLKILGQTGQSERSKIKAYVNGKTQKHKQTKKITLNEYWWHYVTQTVPRALDRMNYFTLSGQSHH